jgi:very-short-patch-repair endonuclease
MTFTRIYNRPEYKDRRRELRATMTAAERMIWERVRGSQLGCRFRRQHSIGDYIVDFYCPTARLVVEIEPLPQTWEGVARRRLCVVGRG